MENNRLHIRLDCEEHCYLHVGDSFYSGNVKNISLGGVLVHFYNSLPGVQVGDNCKVSLNGKLNCEYICEVVRVENSNVALMFIEMDTYAAVVH